MTTLFFASIACSEVLEDGFENYTSGAVSGQGTWKFHQAESEAQLENAMVRDDKSTARNGSRFLSLVGGDGETSVTLQMHDTPLLLQGENKASLAFSVRFDSPGVNGMEINVTPDSGGTYLCRLLINNKGEIFHYLANGELEATNCAISPGFWHRLEFIFDIGNRRYQLKTTTDSDSTSLLDETIPFPTTDSPVYNSFYTLQFKVDSARGNEWLIDDIFVRDAQETAP